MDFLARFVRLYNGPLKKRGLVCFDLNSTVLHRIDEGQLGVDLVIHHHARLYIYQREVGNMRAACQLVIIELFLIK